MLNRQNWEARTVQAMIKMYCLHHHKGQNVCDNCLALQNYAIERIKKCPFGIQKPVCANCHIHCYKSEKREQIRQIMRWSGPRILYVHPLFAIRYLWYKKTVRYKSQL